MWFHKFFLASFNMSIRTVSVSGHSVHFTIHIQNLSSCFRDQAWSDMISRIFWISFLAGFHYLPQLWKWISRNKIFFLIWKSIWRSTGSGYEEAWFNSSCTLPGTGRSPLDKPKRLIVSRLDAGGRQKWMDSLPDDYVIVNTVNSDAGWLRRLQPPLNFGGSEKKREGESITYYCLVQ